MTNRLERIDSHLFQEIDENSSRHLIGGDDATWTGTLNATFQGGKADGEADVTIDAAE